jgi:hypothetical protein
MGLRSPGKQNNAGCSFDSKTPIDCEQEAVQAKIIAVRPFYIQTTTHMWNGLMHSKFPFQISLGDSGFEH